MDKVTVEFALADGRTATVRWVNGPPYLDVSFKGQKRDDPTPKQQRGDDHKEVHA